MMIKMVMITKMLKFRFLLLRNILTLDNFRIVVRATSFTTLQKGWHGCKIELHCIRFVDSWRRS